MSTNQMISRIDKCDHQIVKADENGSPEITFKSDFNECMKQMKVIATCYEGQWIKPQCEGAIILMYEIKVTKQLFALEKIVPEGSKVPCEPMVCTLTTVFKCHKCGKVLDGGFVDPTKNVCEDCCEDHKYKYDKWEKASFCIHCNKRREPYDVYD